jgi:hypothetical protein
MWNKASTLLLVAGADTCKAAEGRRWVVRTSAKERVPGDELCPGRQLLKPRIHLITDLQLVQAVSIQRCVMYTICQYCTTLVLHHMQTPQQRSWLTPTVVLHMMACPAHHAMRM